MRVRSSRWGRLRASTLFVLPLLAACGQAPAEPGNAPHAAQPAAVDPAERAAQASELSAAIKPHVDRSPGVGKVTTGARGAKHADLDGSYQSVVLAKVNADGSRSTACVDDVAEAEAFLKSAEAPARQGGEQ